MIKSTRGNPYHVPKGSPRGGQFCSRNGFAKDFKSDSVLTVENDDSHYENRTKLRSFQITRAEYESRESDSRIELKITDFEPAKTKEEAVEFAKSLGVTPYYDGLSLNACNTINGSMQALFREFPETKKNLNVIGSAQEINRALKKEVKKTVFDYCQKEGRQYDESVKVAKAIASKSAGKVMRSWAAFYRCNENCSSVLYDVEEKFKGVYINEKSADTDSALLNKRCAVSKKYHPVGCDTFKSTIDHEFGHVIDKSYGITKDMTGCISKGRGVVYIKGSDHGFEGAFNGEEVENGLSEYAKEDVREFVAEAWAEFKNNPNPRPIAKAVGMKIETLGRSR